MSLVACPSCRLLTSAGACPHCGAAVRAGRSRGPLAAALLGLALAGCPKTDGDTDTDTDTDTDDTGTVQPDYGVADAFDE